MGKKSKLQFSIKSLLILAVFVGLLTTVAINVVRHHQQAIAREKAKAADRAIHQAHLSSLKMERAQLLSTFGQGHPGVQRINYEISATKMHISANVDGQSP